MSFHFWHEYGSRSCMWWTDAATELFLIHATPLTHALEQNATKCERTGAKVWVERRKARVRISNIPSKMVPHFLLFRQADHMGVYVCVLAFFTTTLNYAVAVARISCNEWKELELKWMPPQFVWMPRKTKKKMKMKRESNLKRINGKRWRRVNDSQPSHRAKDR